MTPRTDERTSPEGLGRVREVPSSARKAGPAAYSARSRRTGRKPSYRMYRMYAGFRAVPRERVPGVAGQAGLSQQALGRAREVPSSARRAGLAASGACSRRAGRKPSYRMYVGFRPVRREGVPGVAGQAGLCGHGPGHPPVR